jgi:hypothetical protein
MHLHKERTVTTTPAGGAEDRVAVTLTRPDLAAIDLALRLLLGASTPRDAYFLDLMRVQAKLTRLEGPRCQPRRVDSAAAKRASPELDRSESR